MAWRSWKSALPDWRAIGGRDPGSCVLMLVLLALAALLSEVLHRGAVGADEDMRSYVAGYVTGPNNIPVTKARLTLVAKEGAAALAPLAAVRTDAQGYFKIENVPAGEGYSVTVRADGYRKISLDQISVTATKPKLLSIRLVPERRGVGEVSELARASGHEQATAVRLEDTFLERLAGENSLTGILKLLPGTQSDLPVSFAFIPVTGGIAFHGAGSAENLYRIDGLDLTNPLTGLPTLELPLEFIDAITVNSVGMDATFANAIGAQIGVETPFGGNEFSGDIFLNVVPGLPWYEAEPKTYGLESISRKDTEYVDAELGIRLGGYLWKDRIWLSLGLAPRLELGVVTRTLGAEETGYDMARWGGPGMVRITTNFSPDQTVQLSGYGNSTELSGVVRTPTDGTSGLNGDASTFLGRRVRQTGAASVRYAMKLQRLRTRVDLMVGGLAYADQLFPDSQDRDLDGRPDGEDSLTLHKNGYSVDCGIDVACDVRDYATGGFGPLHATAVGRLESWIRVSHHISNVVGRHEVQWGLTSNYVLDRHFQRYTGGVLVVEHSGSEQPFSEYRYMLSNDPTGARGGGLATDVRSMGYGGFARDVWIPRTGFEIDYGVRADGQRVDSEYGNLLKVEPFVSPHASATLRHSLLKQGAVTIGMSRSAMGLPLWLADAAALTPRVMSHVDTSVSAEASSLASTVYEWEPIPSSAYARTGSLEPIAQTDIYGVLEQSLGEGVALRVTGMRRNLTSTLDVLQYPDGIAVIANPGTAPETLAADVLLTECYRETSPFSKEEQSFCIPPPSRLYRALEVSLSRLPPTPDQGVGFMVSYVLASLSGDYPGPVPQNIGQDPISILSYYSMMNLPGDNGNENRYGPLPAERNHRAYGAAWFTSSSGLQFGLGVAALSGRPVDVLSPPPDRADGSIHLLARGAAGRSGWILQEQVHLGYRIQLARRRDLTLGATMFNPIPMESAVRLDPRYTTTPAQPLPQDTLFRSQTLRCLEESGAVSETCALNAHFLKPLEMSGSTSMRLSVRYRF